MLSTRDECFLVKCRLLGFAFCCNSPDGPLPSGWPSSSLEAPRPALPSGLQKPHLPIWGSTRLLLCWLHVTHASSFQAVSGSRFVAAGSRHVSSPFLALWLLLEMGHNLGVGPGRRAVVGRMPHGCAGGLRVGTGSGSSSSVASALKLHEGLRL